MSMKKLQIRVGNNGPLNTEQETDTTQNNEMDELAQMFNSPSAVNQSAEESVVNKNDTQNIATSINISVENIIPSRHNKFKAYEGEKQTTMIDSIKEQGVIVPLTLRKIDLPGNYEIISGENRWRCAKLAGLTHVPAYIVECDEETAIMMLTEANLVNRDITYYERVQAYKQQYDVMRRQGKRNDLSEDAEKTDSLDIIARKHGESRTQMYRLTKIADLTESLAELTGKGRIATDAAVKLLNLSVENQRLLADYLVDNNVKLHINHAELIIKSGEDLSYDILDNIFLPTPQKAKPIKNIKMKRFSRFFENVNDANEIEETIEKALQMYFDHENTINEYTQCNEIE